MIEEPKTVDDEAIGRANVNLGERLFREGVSFVYDEDGDSLFITVGTGRPAVAIPIVDGSIYCRIDRGTLEIVGFTILAFVSDILANNKLIRKIVHEDFEGLRRKGGKAEYQGLEAQRLKRLFDVAIAH